MANIDISLDFSMEPQGMGNWCWAATGKSTAVFYDPGRALTQCTVAKDVCRKTTCCNDPSDCDEPHKLSDTLIITGNYVNHIEDVIQWEEIRAEIEENRILCARIKWGGGGGHAVAIYGVAQTETTQWVYIDDPLYGPSYIPYEQFVHNYHSTGSSWSHTYFTDVNNRPRPN